MAAVDGACQALHDIADDLDAVPMGRLAAAALKGFSGDLPRGWRLVSPDGEEVRLVDFAKAMSWMESFILKGADPGDDLDGCR